MGKIVAGAAVVIFVLLITVVPTLVSNAPVQRLVRQEAACSHLAGQAWADCAAAVPTNVWDWLHTVTSP